ncbi:hypothetical protein HYPP_00969 [Hyphomicrobium sp. ghe19]|nr:hypothetical protein HYPP_00969 [Hyphomicrobium sp. ghe19]
MLGKALHSGRSAGPDIGRRSGKPELEGSFVIQLLEMPDASLGSFYFLFVSVPILRA